MKKPTVLLAAVALGALSLVGAIFLVPLQPVHAQQDRMSFAEDIVPIFKGYCISCHQPGGAGYEASGLDLTSYEGLMKGTKFGPMVIPGKPDESNLIVLIDGHAKISMPYGHKLLSGDLRSNLWSWIFQGAKNN